MKVIFFSVILLMLNSIILISQESLTKLQAPSSPAASVLDLQPYAIVNPKSYNELEAALFSNIYNEESGSLLPTDFAIEISPYWMQDHELSLQNYLYPANLFSDQFWRNSSFSIATTQNFPFGDSIKTKSLGLGYRTTIYLPNQSDKDFIKNLNSILNETQDIISTIKNIAVYLRFDSTLINKNNFIDSLKKELMNEYKEQVKVNTLIELLSQMINNLPELTENNFLSALDEELDLVFKMESIIKTYEGYIKKRNGLHCDFAIGAVINFPTNNLKFSFLPRYSFWITPSYQFNNELSFIKAYGVLKLGWYNKTYLIAPAQNYYFDYGFALDGEFKKFSLQLELIGRKSYNELNSTDLQYIGTLNYQLSDQILISYSFGNRFRPEFDPDNCLISILSLNFGFGSPIAKDLIH